MFKKFAFVSAIMAMLVGTTAVQAKPDVIELTARNTVMLQGVMTSESTSKVLYEIMQKSEKLEADEELYLFVDSPGGDVVAGLDLIQGIQGLDREITTITSFGASMAFITVQNLGDRIVMPNGVLMDHRAKGGVAGQIPGEVDSRYKFWKIYLQDAIRGVAKRLGMSVAALEAKHRDEWWTEGYNAVDEGTADRVALVRCGKSMMGSHVEEVNTFFGTLQVTWSDCPLVKAPLKVDREKIDFFKMSETEQVEFNQAIDANFYDREEFLREFVLTGKYRKYFN